MSNKPNEQAQINFIADCLRFGEARKDILQKFAKIYKTSDKTFDTRLKLAKDAITKEQEYANSKVNDLVSEEIKQRKIAIMDVLERKEILTKIARGELTYTKQAVSGDGIVDFEVEPDFTDRKAAIAELNKMDGDYSPTKANVELNVKQLPSWLEVK